MSVTFGRLTIVILLFGLMAAKPTTLVAQSLSDADRAAIKAVITEQMAAFQRDDGVAAFSYAAPGIRRMFGTADNFMAMVRQGYQPVYRPRQVQFQQLSAGSGAIAQRVWIVGPDGRAVIALYLMQKQPDGRWLINGCRLLQAEGEAV